MQVSKSPNFAILTWFMRSFNLILEPSALADVVVHRLLSASLGIYKLPSVFQDRPQLTSIADSKFSLLLKLYCYAVALRKIFYF